MRAELVLLEIDTDVADLRREIDKTERKLVALRDELQAVMLRRNRVRKEGTR